MVKIKFFLKWSFVFSILIIWSYFVITGSVTGSFNKDFNVPIYIQTSAGVEKASSSEILDILFNNDFEIQKEKEYIPIERCSLRAKRGELIVGDKSFGDNNYLKFYVPNENAVDGEGSLTGQKDRERFSSSFEIKKILETNSEKLVLEAEGNGKLNKEKLNFDSVIVEFDKLSNKVSVFSSGDENFEAENLEVYFLEGCLMEEKGFYLIIDNGELEEKRSIEEVRELLNQHPELIDRYENLRRLYRDYWWVVLPPGIVS